MERVSSVFEFVEYYKDGKKKDLSEFVLRLRIDYSTKSFKIQEKTMAKFERNLEFDHTSLDKTIAVVNCLDQCVQFAKNELNKMDYTREKTT